MIGSSFITCWHQYHLIWFKQTSCRIRDLQAAQFPLYSSFPYQLHRFEIVLCATLHRHCIPWLRAHYYDCMHYVCFTRHHYQ